MYSVASDWVKEAYSVFDACKVKGVNPRVAISAKFLLRDCEVWLRAVELYVVPELGLGQWELFRKKYSSFWKSDSIIASNSEDPSFDHAWHLLAALVDRCADFSRECNELGMPDASSLFDMLPFRRFEPLLRLGVADTSPDSPFFVQADYQLENILAFSQKNI